MSHPPLALLLTLAMLLCVPPQLFSDDGDPDFDANAAIALASDNPSSLADLLRAAHEQQLADTTMWHALMHYRASPTGQIQSQVDAPWFFLSSRGKTDPAAELDATLAAFFSTQPKPPMRLTPYCRFQARRAWLTRALGKRAERIPEQACPEFDRFVQFLRPERLTVIFPSAHPNSPSSAFGHTLIRIDHADQNAQTRMLNMSLNFAAEVPPETSSLSYALLGLSGGFKGKYHLLPYHMKLREYGQIDNRDIWEFPLTLTPEQMDIIVRHGYEMLIAWYDYYFFRENCAYHLLSLLDVAFPDDRLTDGFPLWALPVDSIRILEARGLVDGATFTPSMSRIIRAREHALAPEQRQLALLAYEQGVDAIDESLTALPPVKQAAVLDLASDYQRYRRLNSDAADITQLSRAEKTTLARRSRIAVKSNEPSPRPDSLPPHHGHPTGRVQVGAESQASHHNLLLSLRPAYHDLLDPSAGYSDHASIDFFKLTAGWDKEHEKLFLRDLTLLDIQSLEPRSGFFRPISWRTSARWRRDDASRHHRATLLGGAGMAWRQQREQPLGFVFIEGRLVHDPDLPTTTTAMLGIRIGMLWEPLPGWRLIAEGETRNAAHDGINEWETGLASSLALDHEHSFRLNIRRRSLGDHSPETRYTLSIARYF